MGGQISAEDKAIVNIWTLNLSKRGIEHDEESLETFLQFSRSQGVEITTDSAFSVKI